jgi:hypothetical protein
LAISLIDVTRCDGVSSTTFLVATLLPLFRFPNRTFTNMVYPLHSFWLVSTW